MPPVFLASHRRFLFIRSPILKRIAQERLRRGLTQRTVSECIDLGVSSYFKIEQGVLIPGKSSGTARKLERFFGRRLKTLLSDVA